MENLQYVNEKMYKGIDRGKIHCLGAMAASGDDLNLLIRKGKDK